MLLKSGYLCNYNINNYIEFKNGFGMDFETNKYINRVKNIKKYTGGGLKWVKLLE